MVVLDDLLKDLDREETSVVVLCTGGEVEEASLSVEVEDEIWVALDGELEEEDS